MLRGCADGGALDRSSAGVPIAAVSLALVQQRRMNNAMATCGAASGFSCTHLLAGRTSKQLDLHSGAPSQVVNGFYIFADEAQGNVCSTFLYGAPKPSAA